MDILDDQNHVFNITLAKCTGLYQMLDPKTTRFRGKNVYHIFLAFVTLFTCGIGVIMSVSGVYYWTDNFPLSMDYFWKSIISLYTIYPTCVIVHYSDDIWNCLSITCYSFTSHSLRDGHILNRWRERSVLLTTILTVMYSTAVMIYIASSVVLSSDVLRVKNRDGTVSNYRGNVANLYLFVSDDTYNAHYNMFYMVETWFTVSILIVLFIFDFILMSLCLAINCQMEMVCSAFQSVGYKSLGDHLSLVEIISKYNLDWICYQKPLSEFMTVAYCFNKDCDCRDEKKKILNEHDLIYDELKTIIMDHQAVMKKYDAFLTMFKRAMLLQIVVFLWTFIILWFCFIMSFSKDGRFMSSRIFLIKTFSAIPANTFKLFATCYLFGNDQKDSIILALYSSNWTEMDMKCKKLILLTMRMNNVNQKKFKFTRTKIVNMEMFFKTMRDSYSILSVLINYIKTMDE